MNVHMHGLKELVGMRGGLETLGMDGLLAGEVLWSVLNDSLPVLFSLESLPSGTKD